MELPTGTVVEGRYRVLELVNKGGMGAVYKIADNRLAGMFCALKQMHDPAELHDHVKVIEHRFEEEMQVLTALRHPGVPRVLDFFRYERSCCIVMDFVEGQNLEQLSARTPLPVDYVLEMAEQVLEILIYLHGHNPPVVHRDIKPPNVILDPRTRRFLLVDFGLARIVDPGSLATQTMAGTLGYAPAEQMQGHAEPRSDLFSLGATIYCLLTRVVPEVFKPPRLQEFLPTAHPSLIHFIKRAMEVQPSDRFASAEAMLEAVRKVRQEIGQVGPQGSDADATIVRLPDEEAKPEDGPPSFAGERILVVDDDATVRTVVQKVLEREHYEVIVASSGKMALELAITQRPNLVISDLEMPGMDGIALCHRLRSYGATRDIPILLLTGRSSVEDEARCLEAGADDFVAKPIVSGRLVARVQAILRRHPI